MDKIQSWLTTSASTSRARRAASSVHRRAADVSTLVHGIVTGIRGIASLAFGLSFAAIGMFFLLKDGPWMRGWVDRHLGVPAGRAARSRRVITSLRGYFRGVTIIAAFNGVVVGIGA